ncbi:hypothetical protein DT376_25470 [Pseudomonas aeruginosa]|uniref:Glycerate kinase n=1 Tax=Pseudomonas aeruginosa TaxID=287 RepID=A0A367M3Q8_PSEAI|nr:hypothetical protein DT376_25470 [Pseudomonas aeruginosa]
MLKKLGILLLGAGCAWAAQAKVDEVQAARLDQDLTPLGAERAGNADALVGADLVLTGEGRLDAQSLHGKTPVGVARIARQAGVPVVALAGSLGDGYQRLHDAGIDAAFSLAPGPISLEQACAGAAAELEARAEQIARLWRLAQASREG